MSTRKSLPLRPTRSAARSRAGPQPLTRQCIVEAAIAIADASGMDALPMRPLAQRLGVEAMSLYNHVGNKDALIDAMVDDVAGRIALPRAGSPGVARWSSARGQPTACC